MYFRQSSARMEEQLPPPPRIDGFVINVEVVNFLVLWNTYGECENFAALSGHGNAIMEVQWNSDGRCNRTPPSDFLSVRFIRHQLINPAPFGTQRLANAFDALEDILHLLTLVAQQGFFLTFFVSDI